MKRASIKDYKNLLKVFVILLEYGVITKNYIAGWADSILASENESEYTFIELSTSKNLLDTVQILNKNSTNADTEITSRAVLGVLYHLLLEEQAALKTVFEMATQISYEEQLTSDEQFLLYRFDEHTVLNLNDVYGTLRLLKTNFLDFLSIYKGFRLDNYESWSAVSEKVKLELPMKLEAVKRNFLY